MQIPSCSVKCAVQKMDVLKRRSNCSALITLWTMAHVYWHCLQKVQGLCLVSHWSYTWQGEKLFPHPCLSAGRNFQFWFIKTKRWVGMWFCDRTRVNGSLQASSWPFETLSAVIWKSSLPEENSVQSGLAETELQVWALESLRNDINETGEHSCGLEHFLCLKLGGVVESEHPDRV